MSLYKPKPLTVKYGYVIPDLAYEMEETQPGIIVRFRKAMERLEDAFERVENKYPEYAGYLVARAHIRPTLMWFNLREAYHLFRLRTGPQAHYLVRRTTIDALNQAIEVAPVFWRHIKFRFN